tara:strand:- start:69 stop:335 length:267 start_codon:yes stop_codon:yes gene_type:complete
MLDQCPICSGTIAPVDQARIQENNRYGYEVFELAYCDFCDVAFQSSSRVSMVRRVTETGPKIKTRDQRKIASIRESIRLGKIKRGNAA